MNDLNEFLSLMASAKKVDPVAKKAHEIKEHAKQDLGQLFAQLAEAKKQDPKQQLIDQVKENVKEDLTSLFEQLGKVDSPVAITEEAEQHIDTLMEVVQVIEEESLIEIAPISEPVTPQERQDSVEKYAAALPKETHSYQQPIEQPVAPEIKTITEKLKFLEQWVGKISAAGPGSGEVNFRYLDDVNRGTMTADNDNWVLEYDAATKKVKFTNEIGLVDSVTTRTLQVNEDAVIDGTLEVNDDTTINGNLTVNGDITYVNTTTLDVTDKNITIAKGAINSTAADGAGISVDGANANMTYQMENDSWQFNKNITPSGDYNVDLGDTTHHFDQIYANNVNTKSVILDTAGAAVELVPGQVAWNYKEDCMDIRHADGSTLQTGLEHYFRVHNNGTSTLTQGTLVGFGGIYYDDDELPVAVPFAATATTLPLYIMGILTTDIEPNDVGRCTVFGKVRTLDTTGDSGLGETWNAGDLLWAHPTMPGRLTKVQPTAPYPAISVAAVLRAHSTEGVLLVRPTIFPRLWFGRFRDTTNQNNPVINTPRQVTFNQTKISSGFHLDPTHTSRVVAEFNGLYKFDVRLQFTSSNSSASKIWVWYRVDGVDADGTATQYTIQSNGSTTVATLPYIVSMQAGQYFEVVWASDSTNVSLYAPPATAFCPSIPSAVIALTQVAL